MAKHHFTATHGVGIMADGELVADFTRDRDNDTADGQKVYVYSTDDVKIADLVRDTEGFGIAEVKAEPKPAKAAAEPKPTAKVAAQPKKAAATPKPAKAAATPKPSE